MNYGVVLHSKESFVPPDVVNIPSHAALYTVLRTIDSYDRVFSCVFTPKDMVVNTLAFGMGLNVHMIVGKGSADMKYYHVCIVTANPYEELHKYIDYLFFIKEKGRDVSYKNGPLGTCYTANIPCIIYEYPSIYK